MFSLVPEIRVGTVPKTRRKILHFWGRKQQFLNLVCVPGIITYSLNHKLSISSCQVFPLAWVYLKRILWGLSKLHLFKFLQYRYWRTGCYVMLFCVRGAKKLKMRLSIWVLWEICWTLRPSGYTKEWVAFSLPQGAGSVAGAEGTVWHASSESKILTLLCVLGCWIWVGSNSKHLLLVREVCV